MRHTNLREQMGRTATAEKRVWKRAANENMVNKLRPKHCFQAAGWGGSGRNAHVCIRVRGCSFCRPGQKSTLARAPIPCLGRCVAKVSCPANQTAIILLAALTDSNTEVEVMILDGSEPKRSKTICTDVAEEKQLYLRCGVMCPKSSASPIEHGTVTGAGVSFGM